MHFLGYSLRLGARQEYDRRRTLGGPSERTTAVRNLNKMRYFVFISLTAISKQAETF